MLGWVGAWVGGRASCFVACQHHLTPPHTHTHSHAQVDEEASIRANTTVLLGNLANHLSESTCRKV